MTAMHEWRVCDTTNACCILVQCRRETDAAEAVRRYGERGLLLKPHGKRAKLALESGNSSARQPAQSKKAPDADAELEAVSAVKDEPMPDAAEAREPDAQPSAAGPVAGAQTCAQYQGCPAFVMPIGSLHMFPSVGLCVHAGDSGEAGSEPLANGSAMPGGGQRTAKGDAQKGELLPSKQHASPESAAALLAAYAVLGETALPYVPASPLYAVFL